MDDTQLYDVQVAGNYDIFVWGWTPYVDPDPMLSYFLCDQVTTDVEAPGSNDANWCSEEYDALYEQQKVELDPERRREIVAEMLRLFNASPRISSCSRMPTRRPTAPTVSRGGSNSRPRPARCCSPTPLRHTSTCR